MYDDGPSLEVASLWADLAESGADLRRVTAERDQARAELAAATAENDRLRAQLSARHRPTRRPVKVG